MAPSTFLPIFVEDIMILYENQSVQANDDDHDEIE